MQGADHRLRHVEVNAGMLAREALDDGRQQSGRNAFGAADAQLARGRVGHKSKLLDAMLELVENGQAAPGKGATIGRRFDTAAAAVEQTKPQRVLHVRDRLRYRRLRDRKLGRRLGHAPLLHHGEKNMQVPQLETASDTIDPLHGASYQNGYANLI